MIRRPDYQLQVTDPTTGDILLIIPLTTSYNLRYSLSLNDVGVFALSVDDTPTFREVFYKDSIVDVYRSDYAGVLQLEGTYLVRVLDKRLVDNARRLIIGGLCLNHLIDRRIVDPDDDSIAPQSGYSTKAGLAGNVISDYIREQAGQSASSDRQTLRLTVPAPNALGVGTGANLRYESLLDEMAKLAVVGLVDFRVLHLGNADFTCVVGLLGRDRRIPNTGVPPYTIINPNLGNVSEMSLVRDSRKEKTFIYSLGEGEGTGRYLLKISSPALNDSPYNRVEYKEDSSNESPYQQYLSALKSLDQNREQIELEFSIDPSSYGMVYRRDIGFADQLTVQWDDVEQSAKVSELDITVEGAEETISLTVSRI